MKKRLKKNVKENFDYNVTSYGSLNTFYDVFLDKLFETLDNDTNIELHEKIISQVEKQLILKTLNYCVLVIRLNQLNFWELIEIL